MSVNKLFIVALALMLLTLPLFAQTTGKITGKITDTDTGSELPGANVFLEGTNIGAASNISGEYIIINVQPGNYKLAVRYIGYEPKTVDIQVVPNKTTKMDVSLEYKVLEGEDVVITSQAEGQIQAINQQISSNTIKNIVSSAKIQELPEANAAEAVGRLPGVSLQREGGEGNKVVIRGLSPEYNKIQIDGVSMAATDTSNRSVDLSMISPNMLEGIEVSKTAMANEEADKLGGSVNFILRGAGNEPHYNFSALQGYNDLREEFKNYQYIAGASRRFFDNKLGVFIQGNLERKDRSDNSTFASYQMLHDSITIANNLGFQDIQRINKRKGAVLVLDYKTLTTSVKFSNIYSDINTVTDQRQETLSGSGRTHNYNGIHTDEDMSVMMNSLRLEHYFGNLKMSTGVSYSKSQTEVPEEIRIEAQEENAFIASWTFDDLPPLEPWRYTEKAVNDTSKIYVDWFRQRDYKVLEEESSADLNFQWDFDTDFAEIKFDVGGKFKHKFKKYDNEEARIPLGWNDLALVRTYLADEFGLQNYDIGQDFPYRPFIDYEYNSDKFLAGDYTISRVPDIDKMIKYYHAIQNLETVRGETVGKTTYRDYNASIQNDYSGDENYYAAYFMPTITFSDNLTFIPGVRYEHNETEYTANRANSPGRWSDPFVFFVTTANRKNDYVLPMIHVKYKPIEWFDVRASYTETLSRPGYRKIIPTWSTWENNLTWNNVSLEPSKSQNYDVLLSFYNSKLGLFTVGGFQKDIKDFIFNTTTYIIDSTYLDPAYPASVTPGGKVYGDINNPNKARLKGLETEWQSNLWFLPGAMKGIVLSANYTYTHSELRYPRIVPVYGRVKQGPIYVSKIIGVGDGSYLARLLDQPTHILNITIGYDYKGFSVRTSMQYKSDVFKANDWYEELRQSTEPLTLYDMKIKQELPVDGLQVFLNINNFSKAVDQTTNKGSGWYTWKGYYGMSADLGIRYDF